MKALVLEKADGPAGARLIEQPSPAPGAGEVRVRLKAAALNHRELWISRGQYPGMKLPCILGADGAGIVEEVGAGADRALIGRAVVLYPGRGWGADPRFPAPGFALLGMPLPGTVAEEICVDAENVRPIPAHLDFSQAAALPTAAVTAWRGLTVKARVGAGEKVLVTGAGGGVATFALLIARARGAEVFVTSGSDETLNKARALGASAGFNYRDPQWRKALQKASGGVDVVFDGAPAAGLPEYSRALNMGARVVIYGSTGGALMTMSAPDLFLRHASIMGTAMGSLEDFSDMLDFVAAERITPVIDRIFDLSNAPQALEYLDTSHSFGKIVIDLGR